MITSWKHHQRIRLKEDPKPSRFTPDLFMTPAVQTEIHFLSPRFAIGPWIFSDGG